MSATATTIARDVPPSTGLRAFVRKLRTGDEIAHLITLVFAAGILLITSMLVFELWRTSHLSRAKFGWMFFWTRTWDPIFDNFGAAPFIYGTLVTSAVALVIAVPLGLASAIFLSELAPRKVSDIISFLIDLLAAVPSVIYGLLGIFIVVPLMRTTLGPAIKTPGIHTAIFKGRITASAFSPPELCWRSWSSRSSFPFRAKFCLPCRANSARPRWRWAPRAGNPPGKSSSHGLVPELWVRCSWPSRALWAKPWPSPWSSATTPKSRASLFAPGYTIASVDCQ